MQNEAFCFLFHSESSVLYLIFWLLKVSSNWTVFHYKERFADFCFSGLQKTGSEKLFFLNLPMRILKWSPVILVAKWTKQSYGSVHQMWQNTLAVRNAQWILYVDGVDWLLSNLTTENLESSSYNISNYTENIDRCRKKKKVLFCPSRAFHYSFKVIKCTQTGSNTYNLSSHYSQHIRRILLSFPIFHYTKISDDLLVE
jgi:hypothetical protein